MLRRAYDAGGRGGPFHKRPWVASERDRPDVARRRAQWTKRQSGIDPKRLVFIDETWTKTNMARRCGRAPKGERLRAAIPHGHRKTTSFVAGLRLEGLVAPFVFDAPHQRRAVQFSDV